MSEETINAVLKGFVVADSLSVSDKLSDFLKDGPEKLHLAADFDRTMTESKTIDNLNISTWELLSRYLSPEAKTKYQELYEIYRPKEALGEMTIEDAIIWWESTLVLYRDSRVGLDQIENEIITNMPARADAQRLFKICVQKRIPTIIISAGLADIIDLWCQKMEIIPTVVVSTRLTFTAERIISGWEKGSLVHVLNKKEQGHDEITKIRRTRPNTILIGDSVHDADMVEGKNDVIRILVNDPRNDDQDYRKDLIVPQGFDLMTKKSSLKPIADLFNLF